MFFMVIEEFHAGDAKPAYRRIRDQGRGLPEGLTFHSSWVSADLTHCFQVMECDEITQLQQWVAEWADIVSFDIVPVTPGKETAAALADLL